MKKSKLTLEKFSILKLTNLSNIRGGTDTTMGNDDSNTNLTTNTVNSETTTYTTNPNVACPDTIDSAGYPLKPSSHDPEGSNTIPPVYLTP
jgi:hypothetical protein